LQPIPPSADWRFDLAQGLPSDQSEGFAMTLSLLPGEAAWRSRKVQYYTGDWTSIQTVLPAFELRPFSAGPDEPANSFQRTVIRKPLSAAERPIPVGIVSHTYSLAPHREVASLCRNGLVDAGIEPSDLRYEVGLSELGEWMNFRIYLPDSYNFVDAGGHPLGLRLECFNSVDGSSRLVILFGWLRFVCANGLIIGETKIEVKERHGKGLDLENVSKRIQPALEAVVGDRSRMMNWHSQKVAIDAVGGWANDHLSEEWGKKAAARVFHICDSGKDIEIDDLFTPGAATAKSIRYVAPVPGAPERASSKFDVAQAMSFVATQRKNAEERLAWQNVIPRLLELLSASSGDRAR
jgi:hypothetical protein